ncbi:MAG TPA: cytochrome c-type biogenesis protein CcmH [Rhodospirillales bacterium]|jgi:cytochrome c-type biogenesis protein CcmH|nr:MAG: Cytochrome c-type biogenesis protein CcmH [Alphaproteobacteria bacterium MarineAlpha3_Bin1]PPR72222.1 MAG: Cytochrome c-type biogenesis protein CcmH [Alphaproteobacteria bacterium MarineAlpha3_Bin2]HIC27960.1 cytochrome c-type biogenesis protein CcmH [Rhodospirillales bacterium]
MRKALFALALVFAWPPPAWAVNPDEVLSDPVMENRAREISRGLRCLVCQNQSIDDSDADLAKDLRIIVRERLTAGDSDAQVVDFVVSRYGDYVLLKPPFKLATLVLWLGPAAIAGGGLIAVLMFFRRRRTGESAVQPAAVLTRPPPLSDEENRRIEELLKDDAP